jgi:DNA-binding transcriptional regulator YiaG
MSLSLKEQFAGLGPEKGIDLVRSGSPAVISLRASPDAKNLKTISAIIALVRRGVPVLRAKSAIEEILERGRVAVLVPKVENASALASEMAEAGFLAAKVAARQIDVRALRERLGLTQEQFALRYGLDLDAVRNWEHKRRKPDPAAQGYLRVIARLPEQAGEAQEDALRGPDRCGEA